MGRVYQATHQEIERKFAIKHLHLKYANDAETVERFHQDAWAAGSIGHDNICEVIDIGVQADGSPYLVMPLLTGSSLHALMIETQRLPLARLLDILTQTLSALESAHARKIVHRDLKPENIFITRVGDREDFVKLLDFGISKILDQEKVHQLTRTGAVLGTPAYMAPEQAQGMKDLDHRIDLYAVGVILYQGLTRRLPFEGETYNELMFKICAGPLKAPRAIDPTISQPMEELVLKAMARDPAERFSSATEMLEAMQRAAAAPAAVPGTADLPTRQVDPVPASASLAQPEEEPIRTSQPPARPDADPTVKSPAPDTSERKTVRGVVLKSATALALAVLLAAIGFFFWHQTPHESAEPAPSAPANTQPDRTPATKFATSTPTQQTPGASVDGSVSLHPTEPRHRSGSAAPTAKNPVRKAAARLKTLSRPSTGHGPGSGSRPASEFPSAAESTPARNPVRKAAARPETISQPSTGHRPEPGSRPASESPSAAESRSPGQTRGKRSITGRNRTRVLADYDSP